MEDPPSHSPSFLPSISPSHLCSFSLPSSGSLISITSLYSDFQKKIHPPPFLLKGRYANNELASWVVGQNWIPCPADPVSGKRSGIPVIELVVEVPQLHSLSGENGTKMAKLDAELDHILPGNKAVSFGALFSTEQRKQNKNTKTTPYYFSTC